MGPSLCDIRVPAYFPGDYEVQMYKPQRDGDIGPIAANVSVMLCKPDGFSKPHFPHT